MPGTLSIHCLARVYTTPSVPASWPRWLSSISGTIGRKSLWDYELAVREQLYSEFRIASRLADIVYTFPRLCHRLLSPYREVVQLYCEVLQGKETYQSFIPRAKGIVKSSTSELLLEALQLR